MKWKRLIKGIDNGITISEERKSGNKDHQNVKSIREYVIKMTMSNTKGNKSCSKYQNNPYIRKKGRKSLS